MLTDTQQSDIISLKAKVVGKAPKKRCHEKLGVDEKTVLR
jgi:hypothetical protein